MEIMTDDAKSPSSPFLPAKQSSTPVRDHHRDLDGLTRSLASEFPLHSASELRRTIVDAEDDLWPHLDPIDVLDRARERLYQGVIS
jgi:hypothetical protein